NTGPSNRHQYFILFYLGHTIQRKIGPATSADAFKGTVKLAFPFPWYRLRPFARQHPAINNTGPSNRHQYFILFYLGHTIQRKIGPATSADAF
ncbi:hypothetical protein, partial [Salmonella enterica]|uniref:hypothetical protein n=1 Tax=Salmonella enterica TaxID=28901 RepID=UPI002E9F7E1C|nr:hypothetical protein [Salmonella enterica subsp. enterica serovar Paratyphi A]